MSKVCKGKGFAPGHITGFFEIHKNEDYQKKGSTGCGLVLNRGIEAKVQVRDSTDSTRVFLNGSSVRADTINMTVEMLTDLPVIVDITANIPVGCGFGASGAGALSVAYALNQALSLNYTSNHLADIAHLAEVKTGCGLGDVTAQLYNGTVIRTKPGKPSNCGVDFIPSRNFTILSTVLGNVATKSVIEDKQMVDKINSAGRKALSSVLNYPTIDNFMIQAKEFTIKTGLLKDRARDVIEAVEAAEGKASQAMLGDTVFAIPCEGNEDEVYRVMSEFGDVLRFNSGTSCYSGL